MKKILAIIFAILMSVSVSATNLSMPEFPNQGTDEYYIETSEIKGIKYSYRDEKYVYQKILLPNERWEFLQVSSIDGKLVLPAKRGFSYSTGVNERDKFSEGLLRVSAEGLYSYIDEECRLITPLVFRAAKTFSFGRGVVKKGRKYGCIDRNGNVVIDFIFDNIAPFTGETTRAFLDGKYVIIDTNGKIITEFNEYNYVGPYVNGYAFARKKPVYIGEENINRKEIEWRYIVSPEGFLNIDGIESGYTFIDEAGNPVCEENLEIDVALAYAQEGKDILYEYIRINPSSFTESGLAIVKRNGLYGVINTKGEIVCEFLLEGTYRLVGEYIFKRQNNIETMYNNKGEVFDYRDYINYRISGVTESFVVGKDGLYGLYNNEKGITIPVEYNTLKVLTPNRFVVKKNGERKEYIIDANNNIISDKNYEEIYGGEMTRDFRFVNIEKSSYIFVSNQNQKEGLIDAHGNILIQPIFDGIVIKNKNFAVGKIENEYYVYIMKNGKKIKIDKDSYYIKNEDEKMIIVKIDQLSAIIDDEGNIFLENRFEKISFLNDSIIYAGSEKYWAYYSMDENLIMYSDGKKTYDSSGEIISDFPIELYSYGSNKQYIYDAYFSGGTIGKKEIAIIAKKPKPSKPLENYICLIPGNPVININGNFGTIEKWNYDLTPIIENNRVLIPIRFIFEALGVSVSWDNEKRTVLAEKNGAKVQIKIDSNEMIVNGSSVELDVSAKIINDRTFVPLRAVSESFGSKVEWLAEEETVVISN